MERSYIIDRSWMYKYKTKHERVNSEFLDGVQYFMDFAVKNMTPEGTIKCPCFKCGNMFNQDKDVVHLHIVQEGFTQRYHIWNFHGEPRERSGEEINAHIDSADDMAGLLRDAFMCQPIINDVEDGQQNEEAKKFEELMDEAKRPLYIGCSKYSRLSFIVHLFQLKCLHKWSNKSFSAVLALFKDALPDDNILPNSWYECRKMMSELGLVVCRMHREIVKSTHLNWTEERIQLEQHEKFVGWLREYIDHLRSQMDVSDEIMCLARGPKYNILSYQGFFKNGYKFETHSTSRSHVTQNCGIATIGDHDNIYYGVLENIIQVHFGNLQPIYLFKCTWYDMNERSGVMVDEYKFTSVNITRKSFEDEPFIFPSQAKQVFYSKDPLKPDWSVVCRWTPRDTYDVPMSQIEDDGSDDEETIRSMEPTISGQYLLTNDSDVFWVRRELGSGTPINETEMRDARRKQINQSI